MLTMKRSKRDNAFRARERRVRDFNLCIQNLKLRVGRVNVPVRRTIRARPRLMLRTRNANEVLFRRVGSARIPNHESARCDSTVVAATAKSDDNKDASNDDDNDDDDDETKNTDGNDDGSVGDCSSVSEAKCNNNSRGEEGGSGEQVRNSAVQKVDHDFGNRDGAIFKHRDRRQDSSSLVVGRDDVIFTTETLRLRIGSRLLALKVNNAAAKGAPKQAHGDRSQRLAIVANYLLDYVGKLIKTRAFAACSRYAFRDLKRIFRILFLLLSSFGVCNAALQIFNGFVS